MLNRTSADALMLEYGSFVRVLAVLYPICPCACRVVSDMSVCLPCCIRYVRVLAVLYPICPCACRFVSDMSVSLPCCIPSVIVLAVSYLIFPCACLVSDLSVCLPCHMLFVRVLAVLYPICPCNCCVLSDLFTLISWTTPYNIYLTPNAVDWTIACKDYWRCCGLS
jgi:hypothetical protein